MRQRKVHIGTWWKIIPLLGVLWFAQYPAMAQNSKGDRSVGNQRKVRETKAKSVKKKEKARTRDIAGRRLRTKDKSSATRANASHPQPNPYSSRPRVRTDRAAKPRVRIYSERPKERERSWKGDVSGSRVRRVKPRTAEAARSNVYPQRGPYVSNASKKPREKKTYRGYTRTATGQPLVRRVPQQRQRAWKGNIQGGAVGSPSATGQFRNLFSQRNEYTRYAGKAKIARDRPVSNNGAVKRAARLGSNQRRRVVPGGNPASASALFNIRGRKNAYWGKFSKGERAITTDITGRPLRTRNFRSAPAGLVGRDTLKFFTRKPTRDGQLKGGARNRKFVSRSPREQGWSGDVSGWKLRRLRPAKETEVAGRPVFPRKLSISQSGRKGKPLQGGGFQSRSGRSWNNKRTAIDPKIPPSSAQRAGKFSGFAKSQRPLRGGGSISGRVWNNGRTPIDPRVPPSGAQRAGKFSGNIPGGRKGFANQGEGFSGYIKAQRPLKGGGSISGRLWNNKRTPIDPRIPPSGAQRAGKFTGNLPAGRKGFADQGEGFSGYIKSTRPLKGGGSISGRLWNNNRTAIDPRVPPARAQRAGKYAGNLKGIQKGFVDQGEGFTGYIKAGRPVKGGGSISGKMWNNRGEAIDVNGAGRGTQRASRFQGNIKTGKPIKGGGSISGKLWNNNEEPIDVIQAGKGTQRASKYQGNIKRGRPIKGGGSISGQLWNNNEEPILVRVPSSNDAKEAGYSGRMKIRRGYTQNPNANKESIKKQRPDQTTYEVAGLQIKVKRGRFETKPEAAKGSMKGIGPSNSTVKASEYARGMKILWNVKHNPNSAKLALAGRQPGRKWERGVEHAGSIKPRYPYRHNPNSSDDALKVIYLGKAYARIEDFQGNTRMKKYNGRNLHPDSKFAHGFLDNVKEERTFMMNVKLKWAKLFKKSDTQPQHLKRNERRPRYDKGEQGMWND